MTWNFGGFRAMFASLQNGASHQDERVRRSRALFTDDVVRDGDQFVVTAPVHALHTVQDALKARGLPLLAGEIAMLPKSTVKVEGGDARALLKLIEALEELDDVAKVSSNFDIDAEAMAAVE